LAQVRQLAAIMFTDIVGYTALMARDEKKAFEVLRLNLQIHQTAIKEFHGTLVKELGDGILASFPTVSDALSAAIRIQKQGNETGEFKLSIGIHHGEVVVEKGDIFGDAVNIASRIRALGTAGSVLFSDKVADEIKNKAEFKAVSLSRHKLKNVASPMEVFALGNEGLPVPKKSDLLKKLMQSGITLPLAAILLLMLASYAALNNKRWLPEPEEKSIVVMPFRYSRLSESQGDEFLAEGFHTEIINLLQNQKGLRVIARQSALRAAEQKLGTSDISAQLDVQYILEGTVQRDGDQLKITTQLTDAKTGEIVNTKTLERKATEIFAVQKEVAFKVVRDVGLVASEGLNLAPLTDNPNAIEFLRKARKYNPLGATRIQRDSMVWLLNRSCQEDSMYLVPLHNLAYNYFLWFDINADSGDLRAGINALNRMRKIDRASIATRVAEAFYSYYVLKDFALAIQQLDIVLRTTPYNSGALLQRGLAYRRLGRYQEFLDDFSLIAKVNPLGSDRGLDRNIAETLIQFGQTTEARAYTNRLKKGPNVLDYFYYSFNSAVLDGRLDLLDSLIADARQSVNPQFNEASRKRLEFSSERILAFFRRDYRTMINLYEKYEISSGPLDSAMLLRLLGDTAASRASFLLGRERMKANYMEMKGSQQGDQAWINYAVCLAALGEPGWRDEFARIKSRLTGFQYTRYYSGHLRACLLAEDYDMALKLLLEWRQENIPFQLANAFVSPFQIPLKDNPFLDPLRNEPGFEELWEGNHLKVKPLKVPKALQIIAK
jgi:class 3 adenylate cyclase/TolB-like protein